MLTEAIKAFLKIFGIILLVAFVAGLLFGLFHERLRANTTEVAFTTFSQGLRSHISEVLSNSVVEERSGATDFSHLPRLSQIANQGRFRKSRTHTFVFQSESNRPVLNAYVHSNAVYLVELTNIYPRTQRDVWTRQLSTTFPGLRVITTDHR
jgi:hypothetical protein